METITATQTESNTPVLLTIHQLSEKIQVPVGTLYQWVSRRHIPFVKVQRLVRFDLNAVLRHFSLATQEKAHPVFELRRLTKRGRGHGD